MESVFSRDTVIYSTNIRIGSCRFILYFDKTRHDSDRDNAVYMFVCVANSGRPVNVCPEDDMPPMIEALMLCVTITSFLEHWFTNGRAQAQIADVDTMADILRPPDGMASCIDFHVKWITQSMLAGRTN